MPEQHWWSKLHGAPLACPQAWPPLPHHGPSPSGRQKLGNWPGAGSQQPAHAELQTHTPSSQEYPGGMVQSRQTLPWMPHVVSLISRHTLVSSSQQPVQQATPPVEQG